jgi:hypothetical protein
MSTEMLRTVLILREWDEAWTHSRHLEDLRRHYLSFFFTALLGVTAFSASYLARRQLRTYLGRSAASAAFQAMIPKARW